METLGDSFSYSWLIPIKPSFDILTDTLDDGPFIEMDLRSTPSATRITAPPQDLVDFKFPNSQPPTLVHADQLFRNGHLLPLYLAPPKKEPPLVTYSDHLPDQPLVPEFPEIKQSDDARRPPSFLRRCRRSSKQILLMYWSFLKPLYQKIAKLKTNHSNSRCGPSSSSSSSSSSSTAAPTGFRRSKSRRSSLLTSRAAGTKSCSETPRNSSVELAGNDWRYDGMSSSDIENSIQSAIIHCKKSIGIIDNLDLSFTEKEKLGR